VTGKTLEALAVERAAQLGGDTAAIAVALTAFARDFALAVLRKAEETRGIRLTALEKATVIDRAAGE
jgi:hypothetical protein